MERRFVKRTTLVAVVGVAALLGGLAQAQQVGSYVGQTSDGHQVQVFVKQDPITGQLFVDSFMANYTLACRTGDQEWGLGFRFGPSYFISNGAASVEILGPHSFLDLSLNFSGTDSVSGSAQAALAIFAGPGHPPRLAQSCRSGKMSFSATYAGPAMVPPMPAGGTEAEGTDEMGRKARTYIVPGK